MAKKSKSKKSKSKEIEPVKDKKPIESWFQGSKVICIDDIDKLQSLYDKGFFGTIISGRLELSLFEALYLLERNKIVVHDKTKRSLSFKGFIKKARSVDERFWTKYSVYRDIRSKGYITKAALKFGADFSIYSRGVKPGKGHSKWLLFAVNESDTFNWQEFSAMNRVAHSVRKKLLVGVLDSLGDVTYYTIQWTRP